MYYIVLWYCTTSLYPMYIVSLSKRNPKAVFVIWAVIVDLWGL